MFHKNFSILPAFNLSLGYTLFYLSLVVLIPLAGLFIESFSLSLSEFWQIVSEPRVIASYRITFSCALIAAFVDCVFGLIICWVLVRYNFPGKAIFDAMIDLPFALPTAVAGIALSSLYAPNGLLGKYLSYIGIKIAYTPLGIIIALMFVGLPFIVRTIEPVLRELDLELEEASLSLGATRLQTFYKIILPALLPSILTGLALAFARGIGEYGSVIFIAGNIPRISEIVPLVITSKLEQYDYKGAAAIAIVMLITSFIMLFVINILQKWSSRNI